MSAYTEYTIAAREKLKELFGDAEAARPAELLARCAEDPTRWSVAVNDAPVGQPHLRVASCDDVVLVFEFDPDAGRILVIGVTRSHLALSNVDSWRLSHGAKPSVSKSVTGALRSVLQVLDKSPGRRLFRSVEEVDAFIREERAGWNK